MNLVRKPRVLQACRAIKTPALFAALVLFGSSVEAAAHDLLDYELSFEAWQEEVRPKVAKAGALEPFAKYVDHDVVALRMEYTTQYRGEETTVSGLVAFPMDLEEGAPILLWNHGTIFDEEQGPSS